MLHMVMSTQQDPEVAWVILIMLKSLITISVITTVQVLMLRKVE